MKRFYLAAATICTAVTMAGAPLMAQAAPAQVQILTQKDLECINTLGKGSLEACLKELGLDPEQVLNGTCDVVIPGMPGGSQPETEKPETPDVPEVEKPEVPDAPETDGSVHSYVTEVVRLVNIERAKAGLAELSFDQTVAAAAEVRAKEIEISFSHTRPNGTSFSTAITEQGASFRGAGENIAWGQRSPQEVVTGWMNSEGHRANILNKNYTTIGVGYYQNANGTNYWTQLFTY